MVVFFRRKKKKPEDEDTIFMLTKVGDKYNFDGSSVYYSQASVSLLLASGLWIQENA